MIEDFYVSCTRQRATESLNDNNRPIKIYTDTTINGYIGTQKNTPLVIGKATIKTTYNFYCDDFDICFGDRILYELNYYNVISNPKNTAHKDHHAKVIIEKIENVT